MTQDAWASVPDYDDPKLYASASQLRQSQDAQWVLGALADRDLLSCLDVGCGGGEFLYQLASSRPALKYIFGIDRSREMVGTARQRLASLEAGRAIHIQQADAHSMPKISLRLELVTMMAVLHWLYPQERQVFGWIAKCLEPEGVFCLTTYHPVRPGERYGGSDLVVLEAYRRLGMPGEFPADFVPLSQRARTAPEIERMLRERFAVTDILTRSATTRASDADQFARYHTATFGDYYTRMMPAGLRPRFLDTLGTVAMEHMQKRGFVTDMEVRLWICNGAKS